MSEEQIIRYAKAAAREIYNDLNDRRGIKWELQRCDRDVQREIRRKHAEIIERTVRKVLKAASK